MRLPVGDVGQLATDPLLRGFSSVRDRDARADDLFVVEGEVVLRVLLARGRYPARALLLSDAMADKLAAIVPDEVPCYVAPLPVMQAIVGFPIHRGVLALASRAPHRSDPAIAPSGPSLVVALCGLTNHDNVGGVFRNAAAFGATALIDAATCDPLYRKAVRVSVGGTLVVPWDKRADEASVVDRLLETGHDVLALSPRGELVVGRDAPPATDRVALVLGAEGPGLAEATMQRCRTARIPMQRDWDSLNVAVTSGIALAWLRQRDLA